MKYKGMVSSFQRISCRFASTYRHMFEIVNPATGKSIAEMQEDYGEDVIRKFEFLAAGQKKWNLTPVSQRKAAMFRFAELLDLKKVSLARILTLEMGKPITQARNEVRATIDRIQFLTGNVEKVLSEENMLQTSRLTEKVANISAWNYPYFVSANVFVAALLTGNTVLYKPSEYASLTGQEITDLLHEAGIPEDAFMLTTGGGGVGAKVASLKGLGGVFFTGSNKTGLEIAKKAAPNLVKVQLELGGKDPAYVRYDVPDVVAAASTIADGAFYNCGQSCCAVERVYVDKRIYPSFVEAFVKNVKSFKVGDPLAADTYIGPVARQPQLTVLASQLLDALEKGARAEVGGSLHDNKAHKTGYYFPPTVLTDVNHTMSVMREETFGPLIGIQAVEGDAEALELMKDTEYGLTASVFCKASSIAEEILKELDIGTGYWNCCDRVSPRLPWSGRKGSGLGSTLGMDGLRAFVQPKGIFLQQPHGA
ncbi:hypothetical protein O6H91_13G054500 [Diphasiastrum complanatum]|uniref:Uncharacterized protein n=1 Tax=Diphasiastrum complanatum TaxID=34168 RepID=A0ACC2BV32_DIPCM|nr:hypothetical protein O6H91_13G054500 [Diphasiastrum complanatum]